MIKIKSITFKIAFAVLLSSAIIFLTIFGYNYFVSTSMLRKNIRSSAENLVQSTVNRIEAILLPVEKVPETLVYTLESAPSFDYETIRTMLHAAVSNNPAIFGATAALEPYALDGQTQQFAPYYYKSGGEVKYKDLKGVYNYLLWDWYQIPKELDRALWSNPFYDEGGGNVVMATYSVPLHAVVGGKRKVIGIVTADVSLSWLEKIVSSIKIGKTGYGILISRNGRVITHPVKELMMNETVFDIAEASGNSDLRALGKEMIKGKAGISVSKSVVTGKPCWFVYAPLPSSGWSLAAVFPQDEIMADIIRYNGIILFLGIIGFFTLLIVILYISGSITRPLTTLHKMTRQISGGDLDFALPIVRGGDEVGELAESFAYMRESLKKHIKDLTETTTAKERMESELRIAHNIQLSLVPKIFPPYPNKPEFDIYAVLEPAKEVGGDFYDFFFVDEARFCVVIGDVVGKGVPAALMMAVVKTLIKTYALETRSPELILEKVNNEISMDNDTCFFVTVFVGILDVKTGSFEYSSAGHNPPLYIKKDGQPVLFGFAGSTAVGVFEGNVYSKESILLSGGDMLCLYTDGVTEAFNDKGEQFSEERLMTVFSTHGQGPLKDIVGGVLSGIRAFAGDHPQSDDITVLLMKFK